MRNQQVPRRLLLLAIVVLSFLFVGSSCDDDPVGPGGGEAKDYPVYFLDGVDHTRIYRYYPAANTLDSIVLPFEIRWGNELSPDGDRLYACGWDSLYIVALEEDTSYVTGYIPGRYRGGAAVSDDGSLLALSGFELQILRTSDHSLVFSDTDQTAAGVFSHDGATFYAVGWQEGATNWSPLYRARLADSTVTRRLFLDNPNPRVPTDIKPVYDGERLLIYTRSATQFHTFEVYDVTRDSIIYSDTMIPGDGRITIDPAEKYAYYTNPGNLIVGPVAPSEFYRYTLAANSRDGVISTDDCFPDSRFYWWPVSDVAITPDGRWMVLIHWGGFDELVVYDLARSSFAHFYDLDRGVLLQALFCQRNM